MNLEKHNPEEVFQNGELKIYRKLLKEIEENKDFYLSTGPKKMANTLLENCQISKDDFYKIMKKLNNIEKR